MSQPDPSLLRFLGHFHPLLVHLPIGFLLVLAALEAAALRPRWRTVAAGNRLILALTAPASVLSALTGWFLAESGGYQEDLLALHRWTGVGVAVLACLLLPLQRLSNPAWYRVGLVLAVGAVSAAGHYGGSLTHGSDFLLREAPAPLRALLGGGPAAPARPALPAGPEAIGRAPLYTTFIQPILHDYCVSCHGPEKSKGDLRVDSHELLVRGGESGPGLIAGDSRGSLLLQRLRLPMDHDERMPPEGKPQPTERQVELLAWWVDAGASPDRSAVELRAPEPIMRLLAPTPGLSPAAAAPGGGASAR